MRAFLLLPALAVAAVMALAGPLAAQSKFSPYAYVNDQAITRYELDQRVQFLTLLNAPGDIRQIAIDGLIDDRLRMSEAKRMGIALTDAQIEAGMAEFASRANLSVDQFVEAIGQGGVSRESFRDFVRAGIVWREVIRARYSERVRITETEIDRAMATVEPPAEARGGPRVLLSEIVLRFGEGEGERAHLLATRLAETAKTEAVFDTEARQHSASPSRERGGRLDWIALGNLPPEVQGAVSRLKPGETTPAIQVAPETWALFLLRDRHEAGHGIPAGVEATEYAQFLIPGGRSAAALTEAAKVRAAVGSCDDLYTYARKLPAERLVVATQPTAQLPRDIAAELSRLDPGESSTAITRGDALVFLMLCSRSKMPEDGDISRDQMRTRLMNQRLGGYAETYLAQLRAEAVIRYP